MIEWCYLEVQKENKVLDVFEMAVPSGNFTQNSYVILRPAKEFSSNSAKSKSKSKLDLCPKGREGLLLLDTELSLIYSLESWGQRDPLRR